MTNQPPKDELDYVLKKLNLCKCGTSTKSSNYAYHVCASDQAKQTIQSHIDRLVQEAMSKFGLEKGKEYKVMASEKVIVIEPLNKTGDK